MKSWFTVVAGTLQKAGLITYRRGRVTVVDREKLESAIMVACREIAPGMTREEHDWTLHNFRIWRTLSNDNRAMVGALEARAEVRGPEWEKGIKRVVARFSEWPLNRPGFVGGHLV